ncbi:MAG: FGGY-family carbohydrate kinase [Microthrixaceae bacterium]|nr:FGGY-family carbohydrate kinase [Microthrixaceae bacterium]
MFGHTDAESVAGPRIPIAGIAGDQQASLFGQACVSPGMAKNTYGTGSFVLANVGEQRPGLSDTLLSTVAWRLPGSMTGSHAPTVTHYALEGAIFSTGSAIQWLRDGLGILAEAAEVGPLAESVEDTGGVYLVPAFTGLGSPWWDPDVRASVLRITRGTTRAHLARAVVEAMAYQSRDVVDAMVQVCGHEITELRVDGGAAVTLDLLCQLRADQLGVTVARSRLTEATALGATYLAALGAGVLRDTEEVGEAWSADRRFEPRGDRASSTLHTTCGSTPWSAPSPTDERVATGRPEEST